MTESEINKLIHEKIMGLGCPHSWKNDELCAEWASSNTRGYCPKVNPDVCSMCGIERSYPVSDGHVFVEHKSVDYCTDLNAVALAEAKVLEYLIKKSGSESWAWTELKTHLYLAMSLDGANMMGKFPEKASYAAADKRAEACLTAVDLWEIGEQRGRNGHKMHCSKGEGSVTDCHICSPIGEQR